MCSAVDSLARGNPAAPATPCESLRPLSIRAHPLVFGVVLFLASELMLFAAMFAAFFDLRALDRVWPPPGVHLDEAGGLLGTALLAISSLSMVLATRCLEKDATRGARAWLATTIVLGVAFLALEMREWHDNAFGIASHAFGSLYYLMTGIHALHVFIGALMLCVLYFAMTKPAFTVDGRAGAEAVGYYWHFVFVVWLGLWAVIYVVR